MSLGSDEVGIIIVNSNITISKAQAKILGKSDRLLVGNLLLRALHRRASPYGVAMAEW